MVGITSFEMYDYTIFVSVIQYNTIEVEDRAKKGLVQAAVSAEIKLACYDDESSNPGAFEITRRAVSLMENLLLFFFSGRTSSGAKGSSWNL